MDNPLQRLWAVDAADNWTQLIAKEAAVIFRVLDPNSYASWPKLNSSKISSPHFVQLVRQAQLLSTEDSIGAEAPIPPIPPAQQEKREVPLGGRHRCSMDRLHCIEPSYLDLGPLILCSWAFDKALMKSRLCLESKQDPAEGPKVYKEMVCMTKNSGKVTKRSWRQWRLKKMLRKDSSIVLFVKVDVSILRWSDHK